MKKLCLFVVVLFVSFSSFAQLQGTFEATSAYSFNLDTPGVNVRGYVFLTENTASIRNRSNPVCCSFARCGICYGKWAKISSTDDLFV